MYMKGKEVTSRQQIKKAFCILYCNTLRAFLPWRPPDNRENYIKSPGHLRFRDLLYWKITLRAFIRREQFKIVKRSHPTTPFTIRAINSFKFTERLQLHGSVEIQQVLPANPALDSVVDRSIGGLSRIKRLRHIVTTGNRRPEESSRLLF